MIKSFISVLKGILIALAVDLWPALKALFALLVKKLSIWFGLKKKPKTGKRGSCVPINHPAFKKPDPTIYDQYYLLSLGLAVSWQNPDIQILQGGVPVASAYDLQTSTTYTIRATIYNASTAGVVYNMPVVFSYLSFGMGTQSNTIPGVNPVVSLGVQGSPQGIAIAEKEWTTPSTPGHYCIQVSFAYFDDVNPFNNLGQENTQVVQAASPVQIVFQLRNSRLTRQQIRFETDTFQILPPPYCGEAGTPAGTVRKGRAGDVSGATRARNSRANNPLPPGWTVDFIPQTPILNPDEEITISGTITPPDNFHGTLPVNIHAFFETGAAGGVTVVVNRA